MGSEPVRAFSFTETLHPVTPGRHVIFTPFDVTYCQNGTLIVFINAGFIACEDRLVAGWKAQLTISDSVGGTPNVAGATLETFNEASPSILSLSGNAFLVTGGRGFPDDYTAPFYSGSTAAYFGESPTLGYDASQYVAVESGGTATLSFSTPQRYFGLFWGSVDEGANVLSFFNSSDQLIGTVLPSQLTGVTFGDGTDQNGAVYVNIDSSTPFSSVTMTTSGVQGAESFEFDDVAYATVVPEPGSVAIMAAGLGVLGLVLRRKKA